MRFSTSIVGILVASAHALPKRPNGGTPAFQPREEIPSTALSDLSDNFGIKHPRAEAEDDDGDGLDYPDPIDTCPADAKTQENWEHYEIGDWFRVMANAEDDYTEDIQKTIISWGNVPNVFSFYCEPMQNCDANFNVNDCEENELTAKTYFILEAITNFNNYLTALADAVDQTHGIVDGKAGKLVETFSSEPDDLTVPSAPGVLTAGILGIIGSLLTGPAAAAATAMGGALATTAVGIIGLVNEGQSVELEPKFGDFADVTSYLADASATLQTALEDYARWVLTSVPKQDRDNGIYYIDDRGTLPSIIEDGSFAEPVQVDRLPDNLYASLFSGAITELWNKEQAIVVKIPSDEFTLDTPPCDDKIFAGRRWCDESGNQYTLLKYPELGSWLDEPWTDDGKSAWMDLPGYDKLEDFQLSIEAVAKATEHAYYKNDKEAYMDWDPDSTVDFLLEDDNNLVQFVTFNFPFCDLAGDPDAFGSRKRDDDNDGRIDKDDCDGECQILWRISNSCSLFFPWDHTEVVHWKDSCDWIPGGCKSCIPGGFVGSGGDDC